MSTSVSASIWTAFFIVFQKHVKEASKTAEAMPALCLSRKVCSPYIWPSMCCRILCCKLALLQHVLKNGTNHSLSFQTFNSIAVSDVMSMTIFKQCKFLEEKLGSNSSFTNEVLTQSFVSIRDLKKRILSHDRSRTLQQNPRRKLLYAEPLCNAQCSSAVRICIRE